MQHTTRGSASLDLLGGLPDPPTEPNDTRFFQFIVNNVCFMFESFVLMWQWPLNNIILCIGWNSINDTTYWCAAYELPEEVQKHQQYVIRVSYPCEQVKLCTVMPHKDYCFFSWNLYLYFQVSPLIENQHVHHNIMLVYLCAGLNEAEVNDSAPCSGDIGPSIISCISGELIAGWAVGGGVSIVDCLSHTWILQRGFIRPSVRLPV